MKKLYILGAIVCGLTACKPNIEPKAPERGDADFSRYLAVGSSHTAGITDGSYYLDGQRNSFPFMLAQQFEAIGGGEFKQPLVSGQHGWPIGKKMLDYIQGPCDSVARLGTKPFTGALDTNGTYLNVFSQGPFNNMGLPGAKVTDYLTAGFGTQNRYAARMFSKPATAKPLQELLLPEHTFFTVWLGLDDVMDYAMSGGEMAGAPADYRNVLTSPSAFNDAYDSVMHTVTRNGAKGVIMTLPDVLDMPFFNVIPSKGLELNAKDANKFNLQYNSTQVHFDVGMNFFVIEDDKAPNGFRQMTAGEKVRMDVPIDSIRCYGMGSATPMPARYVLTADEVLKIETTLGSYNNTIEKMGADYSIPVADMRYHLQTILKDGTQYNAADFSYDFITGGFFSLDGIHFTGRGNAVIANHIINSINAFYGSSIPYVDVNKFSAIKMP